MSQIEHIIQASDVSHTMQHWHIYKKWNERLFQEMYQAYCEGRMEKDPSQGWYQGGKIQLLILSAFYSFLSFSFVYVSLALMHPLFDLQSYGFTTTMSFLWPLNSKIVVCLVPPGMNTTHTQSTIGMNGRNEGRKSAVTWLTRQRKFLHQTIATSCSAFTLVIALSR